MISQTQDQKDVQYQALFDRYVRLCEDVVLRRAQLTENNEQFMQDIERNNGQISPALYGRFHPVRCGVQVGELWNFRVSVILSKRDYLVFHRKLPVPPCSHPQLFELIKNYVKRREDPNRIVLSVGVATAA